MVIKGDQLRIQTLIKDTLTLLCKNGLNFESQFCMEALIVFTLDNEDVFHVSINETVKNALAAAQTDKSAEAPPDDEDEYEDNLADCRNTEPSERRTPGGYQRRGSPGGGGGKRRRSSNVLPKAEPGLDDDRAEQSQYLDDPDPNLNQGQGQIHAAPGEDSNSYSVTSTDEPPNKRHQGAALSDSMASHSVADDEDDLKDIIVIKEEFEDGSWESPGGEGDSSGLPPEASYGGGHSGGLQPPYGDVDLARALGSPTMGPGPSQGPPGNMWTPNQSQLQAQALSRSATVTAASDGVTNQAGMWDTSAGQDKPYHCPRCPMSFKSLAGLRNHTMLHQGLYKYHCSQCGKGFSSTSGLRGHKATHTGVKEFVCTICGKEYSYKMGLDHHMKVHHPGTLAPL